MSFCLLALQPFAVHGLGQENKIRTPYVQVWRPGIRCPNFVWRMGGRPEVLLRFPDEARRCSVLQRTSFEDV